MQKRRISVPVATVWTSPDSFRSIDASAVSENPNMKAWLSNMTREETIALCNEKRTQTQVLFNDPIIIDEINGEWTKVIVPNQHSSRDKRGYLGWMPVSQSIDCDLTSVSESVMIQSKITMLYNEINQPIFELSFGTFLPLIEETNKLVRVDTPVGVSILHKEDVSFPARRPLFTGKDIVRVALKFLDLPYLWAGMSAYGYDCSGYTYSMLRAGGYLIPRDADDQSVSGRAIDLKSVLPGDLLFFAYEKGSGDVHHVGIYFGDGKMIHSQTPGKKVTITALKGTIYEQELCAIRRCWKEG